MDSRFDLQQSIDSKHREHYPHGYESHDWYLSPGSGLYAADKPWKVEIAQQADDEIMEEIDGECVLAYILEQTAYGLMSVEEPSQIEEKGDGEEYSGAGSYIEQPEWHTETGGVPEYEERQQRHHNPYASVG